MKLIILYENNLKVFIIEYLLSLKKFINVDILMFSNNMLTLNIIKNAKCVIFIQRIPISLCNYLDTTKFFILNIEQFTNKKIFDFIKQHQNIIDYSYENVLYTKTHLNIKNHLWFPYGYNPDEIYNYEKTQNICLIGRSPRRNMVINKFNDNKCPITQLNRIFGMERDKQLFTFKILINVHNDSNYVIHEVMRCDRCVFNKMIVINENSLYNNSLLSKFMIFVDYNKIAETAINVINNYEYYYNKLFIEQDFDNFIKEYQIKLKTIYDEQLKIIKTI